jgi:hypothetical protein
MPSIAAAAVMTADMISTKAAAFDGPSATARIYTRLTDVTQPDRVADTLGFEEFVHLGIGKVYSLRLDLTGGVGCLSRCECRWSSSSHEFFLR